MSEHVSAHVIAQVATLYALARSPFTHAFILTCSFLRPTFPAKFALNMGTDKANFQGKVGLKNTEVDPPWNRSVIPQSGGHKTASCFPTCFRSSGLSYFTIDFR